MKIPKKVRIDNTDYAVHVASQEDLDNALRKEGPPGSYAGGHLWDSSSILIGNDKAANRQARILLHEILHGCLSGFSGLSNELEEKLVLHLESQLAGLIKNNPKVMQYFKETL